MTPPMYHLDFTKDELSYLLELLHNEEYRGNANATLAQTISEVIFLGVSQQTPPAPPVRK